MKTTILKLLLALSCVMSIVALSSEAQAYYRSYGYHGVRYYHGGRGVYYRNGYYGRPVYYRSGHYYAPRCGFWRNGVWYSTRC